MVFGKFSDKLILFVGIIFVIEFILRSNRLYLTNREREREGGRMNSSLLSLFALIICMYSWYRSIFKYGLYSGNCFCCCCQYTSSQCSHCFIQVRNSSFVRFSHLFLKFFDYSVLLFKMCKKNRMIYGGINDF